MDEILPVLIAIALAIAVYVGFVYVVLVFVLAPGWPYIAIAGALAGVLIAVGVLVGTLLHLGTLAAATVTPADVRVRLPKPRSWFERDTAWPHYLFAQSRTDLATAVGHTTALVTRIWTTAAKPVQKEPGILWGWPLLLIPLIALLSMTTAVAVGGVAVYGAVCVALGIAWLGWGAAAGALRLIDGVGQRLRGAKATCHASRCNYRNRLPAYRCSCARLHRDIRAGRLGAFTRRCECEAVLPTTVLRAVALTPICQKCGEQLRAGAGILTDVVLPVFGPTSAGKTRLVYAGMVALGRHLGAAGGTLRPVGAESERAFAEATAVVTSRRTTAKTAADRPPVGVTARLTTTRRQALMHLFDAAGEFYSSREQAGELPFLDDAEGFVFVLDPFSIAGVRQHLTGGLAARLTAAHPASMDPEQAFAVTSKWLRDEGVDLGRKPLAIAVVKADLLLDLPSATGLRAAAGPDEIAAWLREQDLDNMLDSAGRDFAAVRSFLVSSLDVTSDGDGWAGLLSPAHPLLWLLGRSKVPIPAAPQAVAS